MFVQGATTGGFFAVGTIVGGEWVVERPLAEMGGVAAALVQGLERGRAILFRLPPGVPPPDVDPALEALWGTRRALIDDPACGHLVVDEVPEGPLLSDRMALGAPPSVGVADMLGGKLRAAHRAGRPHGQFAPDRIVLAEAGPVVAGWGLWGGTLEEKKARDLVWLSRVNERAKQGIVARPAAAPRAAAPAGDAGGGEAGRRPAAAPRVEALEAAASAAAEPFAEREPERSAAPASAAPARETAAPPIEVGATAPEGTAAAPEATATAPEETAAAPEAPSEAPRWTLDLSAMSPEEVETLTGPAGPRTAPEPRAPSFVSEMPAPLPDVGPTPSAAPPRPREEAAPAEADGDRAGESAAARLAESGAAPDAMAEAVRTAAPEAGAGPGEEAPRADGVPAPETSEWGVSEPPRPAAAVHATQPCAAILSGPPEPPVVSPAEIHPAAPDAVPPAAPETIPPAAPHAIPPEGPGMTPPAAAEAAPFAAPDRTSLVEPSGRWTMGAELDGTHAVTPETEEERPSLFEPTSLADAVSPAAPIHVAPIDLAPIGFAPSEPPAAAPSEPPVAAPAERPSERPSERPAAAPAAAEPSPAAVGLVAAIQADHIPTLRSALEKLRAEGGREDDPLAARAEDALSRLESKALGCLDEARRLLAGGDPLSAVAPCREAARLGLAEEAEPLLREARRQAKQIVRPSSNPLARIPLPRLPWKWIGLAFGALALGAALVVGALWAFGPSRGEAELRAAYKRVLAADGDRAAAAMLLERVEAGERSGALDKLIHEALPPALDGERRRLEGFRRDAAAKRANAPEADRVAAEARRALDELGASEGRGPQPKTRFDRASGLVDKAGDLYRSAAQMSPEEAAKGVDGLLGADPSLGEEKR